MGTICPPFYNDFEGSMSHTYLSELFGRALGLTALHHRTSLDKQIGTYTY